MLTNENLLQSKYKHSYLLLLKKDWKVAYNRKPEKNNRCMHKITGYQYFITNCNFVIIIAGDYR